MRGITVDASDWISAAALTVSMISAALTLRVMVSGARDEAYQEATALFLEVDRALLAYPEVRCFFYEGATIPAGDDREDRAAVVAETILDVFEWIWHRRSRLSKEDRAGWEAYMRDMFQNSAVLRAFHYRHRDWHPLIDRLVPDP